MNSLKKNIVLVLCVVFVVALAFELAEGHFKRKSARKSLVDIFEVYNYNEMKKVTKNIIKDDIYKYRSISLYVRPYFATANGFETIGGYVNVYSKRFKTFWTHFSGIKKASEHFQKYFLGWGNRVYIFNPKDWRFNLNYARIANLGYLFSLLPVEDENLKLIYRSVGRTPVYLYKTKVDNERFYYSNKVIKLKSEEEFYKLVETSESELFRETSYVIEGELDADYELEPVTPCLKTKYSKINSDNYEIYTEGCSAAVLGISIQFSSNWRAFDDNGQELKLFRANGPFMATFVPKNTKKVFLKYQTKVYNPISKFIF